MRNFYLLLALLILSEKKLVSASDRDRCGCDCGGFGYELLETKLEVLDARISKLLEQQERHQTVVMEEIVKQKETLTSELSDLRKEQQGLLNKTDQLGEHFKSDVETLISNSRQILTLQDTCIKMQNQLQTSTATPSVESPNSSEPGPCAQKNDSGLCLMQIGNSMVTIYQHRYENSDNIWIVLMQRNDGSENFDRNWQQYRDGFGTVGKEFWFGLEKIHQLTSDGGSYALAFELQDFAGNYRNALYSNFVVGSERANYVIEKLGSYSGAAGDSFSVHNGKQFATSDRGAEKACAVTYTGGWWYFPIFCYDARLTGRWDSSNSWTSIVWKGFGSPANLALKTVRMMIKKT